MGHWGVIKCNKVANVISLYLLLNIQNKILRLLRRSIYIIHSFSSSVVQLVKKIYVSLSKCVVLRLFLKSLVSFFSFQSIDSYKLEDDEIDWKSRDYEKEIGCMYFFCSCRNIEIINQAVEIEETHLPPSVIRALPGDMIKSLLRLRTFYIFSTLRASLRFLLLF